MKGEHLGEASRFASFRFPFQDLSAEMKLLGQISARLIAYLLVVAVGLTTIFFVPRFAPADPIEAMLAKVSSQGSYMSAAQTDALRESLADSFGLKGSLLSQYGSFLKRVLFTGDFGPSLAMYPTPVRQLIGEALPWTFGAQRLCSPEWQTKFFESGSLCGR